MLELNNNKEKTISFEASISGINPIDLTGYLRIEIDGIEYGFKAKIDDNSIDVNIPSLKSITHRPLRDSESIKAKLEIVGNGDYLVPWQGTIKIKNSIMIEAKIKENDESNKLTTNGLKVTVKETSDITPKKSLIKKNIIKENKLSHQKNLKKPLKKSFSQISNKNIQSIKITKEHIDKFMERNGTLNPKIKSVILETCRNKVGDGDLKLLFKELYNYYKKIPDFEKKIEQK